MSVPATPNLRGHARACRDRACVQSACTGPMFVCAHVCRTREREESCTERMGRWVHGWVGTSCRKVRTLVCFLMTVWLLKSPPRQRQTMAITSTILLVGWKEMQSAIDAIDATLRQDAEAGERKDGAAKCIRGHAGAAQDVNERGHSTARRARRHQGSSTEAGEHTRLPSCKQTQPRR